MMDGDKERLKQLFEKREKEVIEACTHFGLTKEEEKNGICVINNNERMRDFHGINGYADFLKKKGAENKKVRITTYYDPDYPLILQTIIVE